MHARPSPNRVIAIAASAGGVEGVRQVAAGLPADLPAAICVVVHIPAWGHSRLAPILDRESELEAVVARHGAALRAGTIYVAPADHHLLVSERAVQLGRGPKEHGTRPAADPLLRSLAEAWGPRAVAVVLSGALHDGASGAAAVAAAGGTVIVQDPRDALVTGMPESAIAATSPHHIVPVAAIAGLLRELAATPVGGSLSAAPG